MKPKFIIGVTGFFLSTELLYAEYRRRKREWDLFNTIKTGSKITLSNPDEIIPRQNVVDKIKKILSPPPYHAFYHFIGGETGVGKSTAISKAINEVSHGVIYIDMPAEVEKFGDDFAKALNISSFEKPISFTSAMFRNILGIPLESGTLNDLTKIFTCCLL